MSRPPQLQPDSGYVPKLPVRDRSPTLAWHVARIEQKLKERYMSAQQHASRDCSESPPSDLDSPLQRESEALLPRPCTATPRSADPVPSINIATDDEPSFKDVEASTFSNTQEHSNISPNHPPHLSPPFLTKELPLTVPSAAFPASPPKGLSHLSSPPSEASPFESLGTAPHLLIVGLDLRFPQTHAIYNTPVFDQLQQEYKVYMTQDPKVMKKFIEECTAPRAVLLMDQLIAEDDVAMATLVKYTEMGGASFACPVVLPVRCSGRILESSSRDWGSNGISVGTAKRVYLCTILVSLSSIRRRPFFCGYGWQERLFTGRGVRLMARSGRAGLGLLLLLLWGRLERAWLGILAMIPQVRRVIYWSWS
ncbi:hypothetical protein EJ08DRAFT_156056 [Tothia fuscella]|uniref:Uncharacterized protein n=1 Tax=Tothia fuscella TaxID=1048955 RepID=A0A9P4P3K6_9PEZI|nr:hypothetical protein EJ08DRAFT_156056 [Tothia fuscella]